jgi:ketosteroid isomerase-like protein
LTVNWEEQMPANTLKSAIDASHAAGDAILKGDAGGYRALFSEREDVTLGNPFGPFARGREGVEARLAVAASNYRDGGMTGFDLVATYSSSDLAVVVENERGKARVGGAQELAPLAVRVTSVFRLEGDVWKLVHRHADPVTTPRPAESVIAR